MKWITKQLLNWYSINKRDLPWRHTKNPYYIWISEIMLQQTRVEAVKIYYKRFIKELPNLSDLAQIEEDKLLKLWEGLGYYSRVRNMQKSAKILIKSGQNNLPSTYQELINLPGIGKYTAGAILSIAYDQSIVAIDGNVYRIISRFYGIEEPISKSSSYRNYTPYLEEILPVKNCGDFTQSFMDLGSMICLPKNPKCSKCPLNKQCVAYKNQMIEKYPVIIKKKVQRIEERNVYIYLYQNKIGIKKRENKGLLASMYEFPNFLESDSLIDIENKLINKNISYNYVKEIGEAKHIFSHIIWYMKGFIIDLKEPIDLIWATKEELFTKYSIPSAFSYYLKYVEKLDLNN